MCKKSTFDDTNKWYIHNPASVLENDTQELLWDFDISQKTRPHNNLQQQQQQQQQQKENLQNCGLYCPGWPQNKTEGKWKGR